MSAQKTVQRLRKQVAELQEMVKGLNAAYVQVKEELTNAKAELAAEKAPRPSGPLERERDKYAADLRTALETLEFVKGQRTDLSGKLAIAESANQDHLKRIGELEAEVKALQQGQAQLNLVVQQQLRHGNELMQAVKDVARMGARLVEPQAVK